MLAGPDLSRALEWQQRGLGFSETITAGEPETVSPNAAWAVRYQPTQPQETDNAFQFVEIFIKRSQDIVSKSEARERTIKRTVIALTCLVFLAGLGAGLFGYYNYRNAVVAEARSLWYPLSSYSSLGAETGADGLLAVARSKQAVREQLILQILNNKNIAEAFSVRSELIMNAVVGINASQREKIASTLQAAKKSDLPNENLVARALALLTLDIISSPETLIEAIKKTTSFYQLGALGQSLATAAGRLSDTQAADITQKLLDAILKTTEKNQLYALGQGLAAVAGKLGKTQADIMSNELTAALQKNTDGGESWTLASISSVLVPRLTMNESQAKQWLEICKIPFIDRTIVAEAIRKHNPGAPKAEQGIWAFLEWAVKRYDVDVD